MRNMVSFLLLELSSDREVKAYFRGLQLCVAALLLIGTG
jgi:hypothetical protein